ncbi:hypothetical protein AB0I16_06435 [Streptomyces sp. NPDC050703]|uniref:hypothetical protein n=1 Tax=Streptomyces sp. NPDC050703 TaxID=3157218 RepID=UPI003442DE81
MRRKEAAVLSLSAAALLMVGAGTAHAGDDEAKFQNNTQILSCLTLEVLDIPIASSANNNIDCSKNEYSGTYERMAVVASQQH